MPDGKDQITAEDIAAAVAAANAPLADQIAQLAKTGDTPDEPPRVYTRAELDDAVQRNVITESQRDDILERQQAEQINRQIETGVTSAVTDLQRNSEVGSQIGEYSELVPDLTVEGSEARNKVRAQYDRYVALGLPKSKTTELAALQAVYGDVNVLRARSTATQDFERHQETGGTGTGVDEPTTKGGEKLKLSPRERAWYEQLIRDGRYKDWDAVEAELKFANPAVRRRNGAKAA